MSKFLEILAKFVDYLVASIGKEVNINVYGKVKQRGLINKFEPQDKKDDRKDVRKEKKEERKEARMIRKNNN